jgi:hypothetical protein
VTSISKKKNKKFFKSKIKKTSFASNDSNLTLFGPQIDCTQCRNSLNNKLKNSKSKRKPCSFSAKYEESQSGWEDIFYSKKIEHVNLYDPKFHLSNDRSAEKKNFEYFVLVLMIDLYAIFE